MLDDLSSHVKHGLRVKPAGHCVYKKARAGGAKFRMPPVDNQKAFDDAFRARVKALRQAKGFSQVQMADLLGIPADNYPKYENRGVLPLWLIPRFATLAGVDIEFLVTGRNRRLATAAKPLKKTRIAS